MLDYSNSLLFFLERHGDKSHSRNKGLRGLVYATAAFPRDCDDNVRCFETKYQVGISLSGWPPQDACVGSGGAVCLRGGQAGWTRFVPPLCHRRERASSALLC